MGVKYFTCEFCNEWCSDCCCGSSCHNDTHTACHHCVNEVRTMYDDEQCECDIPSYEQPCTCDTPVDDNSICKRHDADCKYCTKPTCSLCEVIDRKKEELKQLKESVPETHLIVDVNIDGGFSDCDDLPWETIGTCPIQYVVLASPLAISVDCVYLMNEPNAPFVVFRKWEGTDVKKLFDDYKFKKVMCIGSTPINEREIIQPVIDQAIVHKLSMHMLGTPFTCDICDATCSELCCHYLCEGGNHCICHKCQSKTNTMEHTQRKTKSDCKKCYPLTNKRKLNSESSKTKKTKRCKV